MEVRAPRTNERPPYIRMKRQAGSYVDDARTEPPAAAAIIRPERQKTRRSRDTYVTHAANGGGRKIRVTKVDRSARKRGRYELSFPENQSGCDSRMGAGRVK